MQNCPTASNLIVKTGLVKAICILMLLALIFATSFVAAHAQNDLPVWAENLVCDPDIQKYQGLAYCTGVISSDNSQSYKAYVIIVDLNSPDIQIEYVIAEGIDKNGDFGECKDVNRSTKYLGGVGCNDPDNQDWYPVMSLEQAVQRLNSPNLAVVINGDYSACTTSPDSCKIDNNGQPTYREHGPEGLTVVEGKRLDGIINGDRDNNVVNRPWLAISQDAPLRAEIHQFDSNHHDDGSLPYNWIWTGVGGAPWLIEDGKISEAAIRICDGASDSCYENASQTAVGLTQDKRWLFFVLGVKPEKLLDLARFMNEKLDVWQAIKLDGGGSSQLYYAGASEPFIEPGDRRFLTNYLAIIAQSGSGIFPPVEPLKPLPITEPNWLEQLWQSIQPAWQNIQQGIEEWWQQFVSDLQVRFEEFLNEIQRRFIEWIEIQLQEFVNQLCGAAMLPAGIIIFCWVSWKRRR